MNNSKRSVLSECGLGPLRLTPVAFTLFDSHVASKAAYKEVHLFRTFVATMLNLANRMRPECLGAVAFLTTRIHDVDAEITNKPRSEPTWLLARRDLR